MPACFGRMGKSQFSFLERYTFNRPVLSGSDPDAWGYPPFYGFHTRPIRMISDLRIFYGR